MMWFAVALLVGSTIAIACCFAYGAWQLAMIAVEGVATAARWCETYRNAPRRAARRTPRSHVRRVPVARVFDQELDGPC